MGINAIKCVWRSEDNFRKLILSFYLYVALGHETMVSSLTHRAVLCP